MDLNALADYEKVTDIVNNSFSSLVSVQAVRHTYLQLSH